jgi:predicted alpha/beta hydrolase family esterase
MRVSDTAILIVPGLGNSGPDHWQSRWQARLSTARRVEQEDWERADRASWMGRLVDAANQSTRPAIIVAHSLGVLVTVHAAPQLAEHVVGAFLVGLSDWERSELLADIEHDFAPIPRAALPFPSVLVASRNDPYCDVGRALDFARAWGSDFVDAGESGHINTLSGHGPWPEGLMRLASFLSKMP